MKQKTRRKLLWTWMLIFTLALSLPAAPIQAANEANTILLTETESEVQTEAFDTANALKEEMKLRQELVNSYSKLEEKYQREKTFSRSVIYVLIFVIAILVVVLFNVVFYYRRKLYHVPDEVFGSDFREKEEAQIRTKKLQEEVLPQEKDTQKESIQEEFIQEEFIQEESIQEEAEILEEELAKKIEAETILEEDDGLELIQIGQDETFEKIRIEEKLDEELLTKELLTEENSVQEASIDEVPTEHILEDESADVEILVEKMQDEVPMEELLPKEVKSEQKIKRFKTPARKPKQKKAAKVTGKSVTRINDLEVLDFNDED